MSLRLKIVLAVSLILNVFLIGIGLGIVVTGTRLTPAQAAKRPVPNVWLASEVLPPADRTAFRQMLRDQASAVQPELKSVRPDRHRLRRLPRKADAQTTRGYGRGSGACTPERGEEGGKHRRRRTAAAGSALTRRPALRRRRANGRSR